MTVYTDARGSRSTTFQKTPKRIVSLVPSQTELLADLGLDEEVIGITKFCIHPTHWFQTKKRIGGTKNLNLDAIRAMQPDLILANKEENVKKQVETLAKEFPVWVTDIATLQDAQEMIAATGELTNRAEEATVLNTHITNAFQQFEQTSHAPLKAAYLIWKDPYLAVGGDTFIHEMLLHAGFQNSFAHAWRYPEITMDQLREATCDVLLLSSEPYPFSGKHVALLQPQRPGTRILLVDGTFFSWYGSRLQHAPAYFKQLRAALSAANT